MGHCNVRVADGEAILSRVRLTFGAEVRGAAFAGVLLAALCGCTNTAQPTANAPDSAQQTRPGSGGPDRPQALLTPGDAPTIEKLDDSRYKVTAEVSPEGCVSVTLEDGRSLLLFAPYGSHLSADSPRIRLTGGYDSFDVGDSVELSGWVDDVWKAVGTSAPTEWRRCVGGRGDHEPMLVVATNDG